MLNFRKRLVVLALAASSLTACATAPSSSCPPITEYTPAQLSRAADEVERYLPEDSVVVGMLSDYSVLRQQVRICRK